METAPSVLYDCSMMGGVGRFAEHGRRRPLGTSGPAISRASVEGLLQPATVEALESHDLRIVVGKPVQTRMMLALSATSLTASAAVRPACR